jgi:ribosomal-protein-alanine N-acetyltransferase
VTPVIREARLDDVTALARIHRAAFDEPWDEESFRRLLESVGAFALVGSNAAASDLQSFILVQVAADESEILSIGTLPPARRAGLARALILEAARQAALRHAKTMFLEVAEGNDAALALYRDCGFTAHGRRRGYYVRSGADIADALMLRADLPIETGMGMGRGLD